MVTNKSEAIHLMSILHRYLTEKDALKLLKDMEFEVAEHTDNESLRDSIRMVLEFAEPSKPTWDNLYMCNCEEGWNNCVCDGNGGKRDKD